MGTRVGQRPVVDGASFRQALGRYASGVVVVTGPGPVGLAATSFTSAGLDPPLVSFYVARSSPAWPRLRDAAMFAVNVLAADQAEIASRFAADQAEIASRFAGPGGGLVAPQGSWQAGPGEVPILPGAAAHLLCEPYDTVALGDHWLVVGLVVETGVGPGGAPLLYHRGRYGRFTAHGDFH